MRLNHAPHCHAVIRGLGKTTARAKVVNTFLMQNARITFLMQIARILPVTCSFLNWGEGRGSPHVASSWQTQQYCYFNHTISLVNASCVLT